MSTDIIDLRTSNGIENISVLVAIERGKRATLSTVAFIKYDECIPIDNALIKQCCSAFAKQEKLKEKEKEKKKQSLSFGVLANGIIQLIKR